jgi:hypothetical protein
MNNALGLANSIFLFIMVLQLQSGSFESENLVLTGSVGLHDAFDGCLWWFSWSFLTRKFGCPLSWNKESISTHYMCRTN